MRRRPRETISLGFEPARCFGCGVCRPACASSAIQLIPREEDSQAAGVWLKEV